MGREIESRRVQGGSLQTYSLQPTPSASSPLCPEPVVTKISKIRATFSTRFEIWPILSFCCLCLVFRFYLFRPEKRIFRTPPFETVLKGHFVFVQECEGKFQQSEKVL
jgi:hypothetical protein